MIASRHSFRPLWLALVCGLCLPLLMRAETPTERTRVLVETSKGKFVLELYNETPIHRDAFLANVRSGFYEGIQFHRIIQDFMVQAGHPGTKGLSAKDELPEEGEGESLTAELLPEQYIHERGALAAARLGDDVNPEKKSSSTQFYIVTGKYYTDMDLNDLEQKNGLKYTPAQREAYKLKGGAPHLDGGYTVFGRLLEGWKVIDKIQRVSTGESDRPLKPVVIKRMSIITGSK